MGIYFLRCFCSRTSLWLVIAASNWRRSTLPSPVTDRQWQESGILPLIKINRWLSAWGNSSILLTLFLHCICAGLTFCLCPFHRSPDFMVARGTEEGGWASVMGILWPENSCSYCLSFTTFQISLFEFYFWVQNLCVNKNALHWVKEMDKGFEEMFLQRRF